MLLTNDVVRDRSADRVKAPGVLGPSNTRATLHELYKRNLTAYLMILIVRNENMQRTYVHHNALSAHRCLAACMAVRAN